MMASPESLGGMPEKGVVLILPHDPDLKLRLQRKLEEYKSRLREAKTTMDGEDLAPYRAPERLGSLEYYDSYYKVAALERLLTDGRVAAEPLSLELLQIQGQGFRPLLYTSAFQVIEAYVKDRGDTLIGGTGLPETE